LAGKHVFFKHTKPCSQDAQAAFYDSSSHKFGASFKAAEQLATLKNALSAKLGAEQTSAHTAAWPADAKKLGDWHKSREFHVYIDNFVAVVAQQLKTLIETHFKKRMGVHFAHRYTLLYYQQWKSFPNDKTRQ